MDDKSPPPHVLIFPLPYQGPMNSMFKLAEIICREGLKVTFLVTEFIHRRLLSSSNLQSLLQDGRNFQLLEISDGLPDDHPRSGDRFAEVLESLKLNIRPLLKDMLNSGYGIFRQPVTCIIADGIMGWTFDLAQEIKIPIFYCRTLSPCSLWTFFCLPGIIDSGELPPPDASDTSSGDMDKLVTSVPGTEAFLRRRDLPRFNHLGDTAYDVLQLLKQEGQENRRAHGLILNTFEELDGLVLSHLRKTCPNIYSIGPIHAPSSGTGSTSFWAQDRSCLNWLDRQPVKSVIYVSFGSITTFSKAKLVELWYGLVNSGVQFLWVMRPDFIIGENWESDIPAELSAGTKQRGCIVGWAPQAEVLDHAAVGGFLTHSGWNSTLESIYAGVPMLCWPYFMDQQVNSRFVSAAWRLGLDMKDTCDRAIVEEMVRELMVVRNEEFCQRADEMAELARKGLTEGGSSFCHFRRLVNDICSMASQSS